AAERPDARLARDRWSGPIAEDVDGAGVGARGVALLFEGAGVPLLGERLAAGERRVQERRADVPGDARTRGGQTRDRAVEPGVRGLIRGLTRDDRTGVADGRRLVG